MNVNKKILKNAGLFLLTPVLGFFGTACDSAKALDITSNIHTLNQNTELVHKYYRDGSPSTETINIHDINGINDGYTDNSKFYVSGELDPNGTAHLKLARQLGNPVSVEDIAKGGNINNIDRLSLSDNYNRVVVNKNEDGSYTKTEYGEFASDGYISQEGRHTSGAHSVIRRDVLFQETNLTAEEAFADLYFDDYCL